MIIDFPQFSVVKGSFGLGVFFFDPERSGDIPAIPQYVAFPKSEGWSFKNQSEFINAKVPPECLIDPNWNGWNFHRGMTTDGKSIFGLANDQESKEFQAKYPFWPYSGRKQKSFHNSLLRFEK